MFNVKKSINRLTGLFILIFVFASMFFVQPANAVNVYQHASFHIRGYRYLNDHQVQVWFDKGVSSATTVPEMFKVYQGVGTGGTEIPVVSVPYSDNSNITGVTGISPGTTYIITTANGAFTAGQTYTVAITNTIVPGNGLTLGNYNFRKDPVFSFVVPDGQGSYGNVDPVVYYTPYSPNTNVPIEGNLYFSVSIPIQNYSEVLSGMKLYKSVGGVYTEVPLDNTFNGTKNGDIYAPVVTDDHTFFFMSLTGDRYSQLYNLDMNTDYKWHIPAMTTVNNKTIAAQDILFHTQSSLIPTQINTAPTVTTQGNALQITWPASADLYDLSHTILVSPAATGYNVYASTNKYWGFTKISSSPVTGTSFLTSNASPSLNPGTTYYFRVTSVKDDQEAGFSPYVQGTTP